jgi:hypothetical protein
MLQPHSFLWHYLWLAPCVLLASLAFLMWRRGLHKEFPAFFCYAIFEAAGGGILYVIDMNPSLFSDDVYWRSYLSFLIAEVFIKSMVVGEIVTHLLRRYPPLARLGKILISGVGILLVFAATIIAAYANPAAFRIVSATRILGRSVSVVQCGLIVFLFVFAAHFHLRWQRPILGVTLGFGIMAAVTLACWALLTDWIFGQKSYLLDFLNMATYHACVLLWCYCLLVLEESRSASAGLPPEHNLELWNRELERLVQR